MKARALLAALLLAVLVPASARAQAHPPSPARTPKRGGGLWMDAGIGYGYLHLTCATCPTVVAAHGVAATVSVGFTPAQNVLVGLQAQNWANAGGSLTQRVGSVLAVAQWYPWPARGLFLRAGTGIVFGPVAPQAAGAPPASAQGTGVGLALGAGYDIKLSPRLGLAVQAATHISALGDLMVNGQLANDVIAYVTRLGVAVVLR